jgi:hypothetical protein
MLTYRVGAAREDPPMSERFWNEVAPLIAEGRVEEGTMFGFRCVRSGEAFIAMPGHKTAGIVIKLPADRVTELIDSGAGSPVAPAGRTFKEWIEISSTEDWSVYLEEALEFAGT